MILINGYKKTSGPPAVLSDGNTAAWYKSDEAATITQAANKVSQWNDFLGSGRNLTSPNADSTPTWSVNGIEFNGVFNYMTSSFTLTQPEFTYIVVKIFSDAAGALYCGANSGANCPVYINSISGGVATLTMEAGGGALSAGNAPVGSFIILRTFFNGAGSKFIINSLSPNTGNPGTNALTGFTIGSNYGIDYVGSFSHIQVKEVILRRVADNTTDETAIYNYLKAKYSL